MITRYAVVVDALVAALRGSQLLANVDIVDGPPHLSSLATDFVYVGWTGSEDDDNAGTITQAYNSLGVAASREETLTIECVAQSVRGDDLMDQARARCVQIVGGVESVLRATPTLNVDGVLRVEVQTANVRQVRNADGIGVEIAFQIEATSII